MTEVSNTTAALIAMLQQRDAAGRAKYGATLDRTDLTLEQWLQHQAEELLDGAGYALAAVRTLSAKPAAATVAVLRRHDREGYKVVAVPPGQSLDFDGDGPTRRWLRPALGEDYHLVGFYAIEDLLGGAR